MIGLSATLLTFPLYGFRLFSYGFLVHHPWKCLEFKSFAVSKAPVMLQTEDNLLYPQPPFAHHPGGVNNTKTPVRLSIK